MQKLTFFIYWTIIRMAFALSQIIVVTPNQIDSDETETEIFLQFYDIFVRRAFGNYRDILKEVAYSPMMVSSFAKPSKNILFPSKKTNINRQSIG